MQKRFTEIHNNFAFSADIAYSIVESIDLQSPRFSEEQWGAALFSYHFYLAMCMAAGSAYNDVNAKKRFSAIGDKFAAMISNVNCPWGHVMALKITANPIVTKWNSTPREKRDSFEMRELIEHSGYFDKLRRFNEIVPRDPVPSFNALAIASRFKWEEKYKDLSDRLARVDKRYSHPQKVNDPYYDDDFADFRRWLAQQQKSAPRPRRNHVRRVHHARGKPLNIQERTKQWSPASEWLHRWPR
jgi:hypothetical protein